MIDDQSIDGTTKDFDIFQEDEKVQTKQKKIYILVMMIFISAFLCFDLIFIDYQFIGMVYILAALLLSSALFAVQLPKLRRRKISTKRTSITWGVMTGVYLSLGTVRLVELLVSPLDWLIAILILLAFIMLQIGLGLLPIPKKFFWVVTLAEIIILVLYVFELDAVHPLTGLTVEMIGAFVGVLAALVLTKVLEQVNETGEEKALRFDVADELQHVYRDIKNGLSEGILLPVWTSVLTNGDYRKLRRDERVKITEAYRLIQLYSHSKAKKEDALSSIRTALGV